MNKKEETKYFYYSFCLVQNILKMFQPYAELSQQHQKIQDIQNSMHLISKTPLEIIVSTNTMVFIIFNLDKGATNNPMIVMRNFVLITLVQQEVICQILDSPLIQ